MLHERVGGEWSFVETLRHLVLAVDLWVGRLLSADARPLHPLGLPPTDTSDAAVAEMGLDLAAKPTFADMAVLHRQSRARVDDALAHLTHDDLASVRTAVLSPDWGQESVTVLECLRVVVKEHLEHLRFAERDLATLEVRSAPA